MIVPLPEINRKRSGIITRHREISDIKVGNDSVSRTEKQEISARVKELSKLSSYDIEMLDSSNV